MSNSAARRRARRNLNPVARANRLASRIMSGGAFLPPARVPLIIGQPWNTIRLVFTIKVTAGSENGIKLNDSIKTSLKQQAGFADTANINFDLQIKGISVWMKSEGHFALRPRDFVSGNEVDYMRIDGMSNANSYARAGYMWPAHIQASTVDTSSDYSVCYIDVLTNEVLDICIDCKWKGNKTALAVRTITYSFPNDNTSHMGPSYEVSVSRLLSDLSLERDFDQQDSIEHEFQLLAT